MRAHDVFFNVKGIVEAILTHTDMDIEHNKMRVLEKMGFAAVSKIALHLDAVVTVLMGIEPYSAHIKKVAEELGGWDREQVEEARQTARTSHLS